MLHFQALLVLARIVIESLDINTEEMPVYVGQRCQQLVNIGNWDVMVAHHSPQTWKGLTQEEFMPT